MSKGSVMLVSEMSNLVPEQDMARRIGVSPSRLARLRRQDESQGLWRRAFGAYMWLENARERVQALMMREAVEAAQRRAKKKASPDSGAAAAAEVVSSPVSPEETATLEFLRARERRLYSAHLSDGTAVWVITNRLHPLGTRVRVTHVSDRFWREI